MKRFPFLIAVLFVLAVGLSGCDFVGDVIEFGLWTLLVILVAFALIVYLFIRSFTD